MGDIDDDPSTAEALRSKTGESPLGGRSNDAGLASVGQELGGRHAQHPLRLQNELREDEHLKNERRSTNHDAAGNLRTSSLPSGPCPSAARFGQHSLHHDFQTVRKAHIRRFEISKSALVFPQEPAGRTRKSRRAEKTNVALLFEEVNSKAMEIPHGRRTFAQRDSTGTGSRSPKKTPKRIGGLIEQRPPAHGGPSTISVPPQEEHSSSDPVESGPSKFSDLPELVQELLIENLGSIVQDGGATSQKPLKVRPKMASPRYRDRHRDAPQERVAENGGQGGGDGLVEADMEYVYDTFVREPRSKKFDQAQSNHNFGVLIVDDETQTAWEASEDLVMSDNEETEDVEDENGKEKAVLLSNPIVCLASFTNTIYLSVKQRKITTAMTTLRKNLVMKTKNTTRNKMMTWTTPATGAMMKISTPYKLHGHSSAIRRTFGRTTFQSALTASVEGLCVLYTCLPIRYRDFDVLKLPGVLYLLQLITKIFKRSSFIIEHFQ